MTPRQRQVLATIDAKIATIGVPPTYRELNEALGTRSRGNVFAVVNRLIDRGYVTNENGKRGARSLRLTLLGESVLRPDVLARISTNELVAELAARRARGQL